MRITVITSDDKIITLDVDPNESVQNVKALLEVETNVVIQQQRLLYNGSAIKNSEKLSALGVKNDDLLMMISKKNSSIAAGRDLGLNPDGSALKPIEILRSLRTQQSASQRQKEEEELMNADRFNVETQKKIEAKIQQAKLYVDIEVNGVPLKALVNTVMPLTILSKSCVERCGLLRDLDQIEILSGIHVAPIKIGNNFYTCSFVVVDLPNAEFLFSLDMLRKHQCTIDLKNNTLKVGGGEDSVPFLQEKDIPSRLLDRTSTLGAAGHVYYFNAEKSIGGNTSSQPAGTVRQNTSEGPDFEAKIAKLVDLGFDRNSVIEALILFNGNEDQAAGYLFGA